MDIEYRFDRDVPHQDLIKFYQDSSYNQWWAERNVQASLDYCYLFATAIPSLSATCVSVRFEVFSFHFVLPAAANELPSPAPLPSGNSSTRADFEIL